MFIGFQKNPSNWMEKAICWWTKSEFFHCSFIFSDGRQFAATSEVGCTWSNSPGKPINWEFIELPFTAEQENKIRAFCSQENGAGYDWWGLVVSQLAHFRRSHNTRWFCSEIVCAGLQVVDKFPALPPCSMCPADVRAILLCSGYKVLPVN
jgi:hypothetical protein